VFCFIGFGFFFSTWPPSIVLALDTAFCSAVNFYVSRLSCLSPSRDSPIHFVAVLFPSDSLVDFSPAAMIADFSPLKIPVFTSLFFLVFLVGLCVPANGSCLTGGNIYFPRFLIFFPPLGFPLSIAKYVLRTFFKKYFPHPFGDVNPGLLFLFVILSKSLNPAFLQKWAFFPPPLCNS